MASACPNPYALTPAGVVRVVDAPFGSESPVNVTLMPPGIAELDARICPRVMGLKFDPPPCAFEYLLPGTFPFVSSKEFVATSTAQLPFVQYAEKPSLVSGSPVPNSAGQKPSGIV